MYKGSYTVIDCFKNSKYTGVFKADTIKSNYLLKGEKIWRKISLENKENNLTFNSGIACSDVSLFEIMKFGVLEKNLNVFSSDDFNRVKATRIDKNKFKALIAISDTSINSVFDAEGNESKETAITNRYLYGNDVKSYVLKENWVMNSYSGELEKYIIALAPLAYDQKQKKVAPLFWIYYPEWKELLSSFEANNFRSQERISFEDVFSKRYFNSMIFKENTVFDRVLNSTEKGNDFYLENERINEKVNNMEEDLFQK